MQRKLALFFVVTGVVLMAFVVFHANHNNIERRIDRCEQKHHIQCYVDDSGSVVPGQPAP